MVGGEIDTKEGPVEVDTLGIIECSLDGDCEGTFELLDLCGVSEGCFVDLPRDGDVCFCFFALPRVCFCFFALPRDGDVCFCFFALPRDNDVCFCFCFCFCFFALSRDGNGDFEPFDLCGITVSEYFCVFAANTCTSFGAPFERDDRNIPLPWFVSYPMECIANERNATK